MGVVMPVRDGELTIRRAIDSVLGVLDKGDELVIVDDSSCDGTTDAVKEYGSRVRVIPCDGRGIVDALNTGLRASNARYFARCDADDEWLPHSLEARIEALERTGSIACFGAARYVGWGTPRVLTPPGSAAGLRRAMLRTNVLVHGAVLARRAAIIDAGGYHHVEKAEDYDLWMRLLRCGDFATLSDVVYQVYEADPKAHRDKRRVQARSTLRILCHHAFQARELSLIGLARNLASAAYPGVRRR